MREISDHWLATQNAERSLARAVRYMAMHPESQRERLSMAYCHVRNLKPETLTPDLAFAVKRLQIAIGPADEDGRELEGLTDREVMLYSKYLIDAHDIAIQEMVEIGVPHCGAV